MLAGKANRPQRAVHAAIRAGGHAPETVELIQRRFSFDAIGGKPLPLYIEVAMFGSQAQGNGDRLVGGDLRVVITDQGDANNAIFHE
ncbi:hypothetical protein D3C85_1716830 [compost metagenome]